MLSVRRVCHANVPLNPVSDTKSPVFNLSIRLPGEYEGAETHLPKGAHPEARLQASASPRAYIRERVQVEFDGIDRRDGLIAEAVDEYSGQLDSAMASSTSALNASAVATLNLPLIFRISLSPVFVLVASMYFNLSPYRLTWQAPGESATNRDDPTGHPVPDDGGCPLVLSFHA